MTTRSGFLFFAALLAALAVVPVTRAGAAPPALLNVDIVNGTVVLTDDPGRNSVVVVNMNSMYTDDVIWIEWGQWRLSDRAADECFVLFEVNHTRQGLWCGATTGVWAALGDGNDTFTVGPTKTFAAAVDLGPGNDVYTGGIGTDVVQGGDGVDAIVGGAGNDTLTGGAGNDVINGEAGNDVIDGGDGGDVMHGGKIGTGTDTMRFATSKVGVTVTIPSNGVGTSSEGDTMHGSYTKVVGSNQADKLENSVQLPVGEKFELHGGGGNDKLVAKNGAPTLMNGGAGKKDYADGRNGVGDMVCATEKFDGDPGGSDISKKSSC